MSFLVQVFARYPKPGFVKTRLVPAIGEQRACELQIALLEDLCGRLNGVVDCEIWGTEPARLPHYHKLITTFGLGYRRQTDGHLGLRLEAAVASAFWRGKIPVLVGGDCPLMDAEIIANIVDEILGGADVVMVPALDGGYVALALAARHYGLFRDIEWGTETVAARTMVAIKRAGLRCAVLEPLFDVDIGEDLKMLDSFSDMAGHASLTRWLSN